LLPLPPFQKPSRKALGPENRASTGAGQPQSPCGNAQQNTEVKATAESHIRTMPRHVIGAEPLLKFQNCKAIWVQDQPEKGTGIQLHLLLHSPELQHGLYPAKPWRWGCPGPRRTNLCPSVSGKGNIESKSILQPRDTMFAFLGFGLTWNLLAVTFWNGNVYTLPMLWKYMSYLSAQAYGWRAICIRMNHTLSII
jgi:hypothetical protein